MDYSLQAVFYAPVIEVQEPRRVVGSLREFNSSNRVPRLCFQNWLSFYLATLDELPQSCAGPQMQFGHANYAL